MKPSSSQTLIRRLQSWLVSHATDAGSDDELLDRFLRNRDEQAFLALVQRYGAMVLRACRRQLPDADEAEDAFQATFLVLARRASTIRRGSPVGPWLYSVAYRVARRMRHQRRPVPTADLEQTPATADESVDWQETVAVLDEELHGLAERHRLPLILHYLQGQSQPQVAVQLGWSLRTTKMRLAEGRELLRRRLVRRGVEALMVPLALELSVNEAPAALVQRTTTAAAHFAKGAIPENAVHSANALKTAEGVLATMTINKIKIVLMLCLVLAVSGLGAGMLLVQALGGTAVPVQPVTDARQPQAETRGDLPPGAVVRLGDARFRQGSGVASVAFSPDGTTLISGSNDGTISFWEAATGKEIRSVTADQHQVVFPLLISADGKNLVAPGGKGTIQFWEVATGKEIRTLTGPFGGRSFALSPDGKTLAADGKLWDVATGKEIRPVTGDVFAFSPDGATIASWSKSEKIVLGEAATGREIRTWTSPIGRGIHAFAISPDGKTLAAASNLLGIVLWDVTTAKKRCTIRGEGLAFAPNGKMLATWAGGNSMIDLWDTATGEKINSCTGIKGTFVRAAAFSPDGKTLASGADDGTIRRWDVATGKEISLSGHQLDVRSIAFSPDGKTIVSGSLDKTVRLWEAATGKEIRTLTEHQAPVHAVAFSPDGQTLVSGGEDGRTGLSVDDQSVRLWDATTGKVTRALRGARSGVYAAAFSPDGKTVALGTGDRTVGNHTVELWDIATGKLVRTLRGHRVGSVAFSPDGKILASGGRLWEVATGDEFRLLTDGKAVAFSPDGKILAVANNDTTIQLWEWITGRKICVLKGHEKAANALGFSPDGKTLASVSDDRTLRLWDVFTGKEIRTLTGHRGAVLSVAISPDGKTVATASADTTILIWKMVDAGE